MDVVSLVICLGGLLAGASQKGLAKQDVTCLKSHRQSLAECQLYENLFDLIVEEFH
jgi:hypothetical protein